MSLLMELTGIHPQIVLPSGQLLPSKIPELFLSNQQQSCEHEMIRGEKAQGLRVNTWKLSHAQQVAVFKNCVVVSKLL